MVAQPAPTPPPGAPRRPDALHVAKNVGGALAVHLALALNAAIAEGDQAFLDDMLDFQDEAVRSAKRLAHCRTNAQRRQQTILAARVLLSSFRLAVYDWPAEGIPTPHVQDVLRPHPRLEAKAREARLSVRS